MVGQRPQQCFMMPLLVGTDGNQKMSKSLGNYIGIAEPPNEIYGKVMSIPDNLILDYFELVTDVPDKELAGFRKELEQERVNPITLKKRLAGEIVTQLYSREAGDRAEEHFIKVIQKKQAPEEIMEYHISFKELVSQQAGEIGIDLSRLLAETGLVESRSEATRLLRQEAISIDGEKVTGHTAPLQSGSIIKVGKRRFAKVINTDTIT